MKKTIFTVLMGFSLLALTYGCSQQQEEASSDINVGIILGFTGPIESLTPTMAASAELAFKEATDAGILGGSTLTPIRADSTCIDAAAATSDYSEKVDKLTKELESVKGILINI